MKTIVKWYNTAIITAVLGGIVAAVLYSLLGVEAFVIVPILVCSLPVLICALFGDKDERPKPGAMYRRCLITIFAVLAANDLILAAYAARADSFSQLAFMLRWGDSTCILTATMLLMSAALVPVLTSRRIFWVLTVMYDGAVMDVALVLCYGLHSMTSGLGAVLMIGNIMFTLPALIALGAAVAVFALTWWLHGRRHRQKCGSAA